MMRLTKGFGCKRENSQRFSSGPEVPKTIFDRRHQVAR
jgi:hypothetical protein